MLEVGFQVSMLVSPESCLVACRIHPLVPPVPEAHDTWSNRNQKCQAPDANISNWSDTIIGNALTGATGPGGFGRGLPSACSY